MNRIPAGDHSGEESPAVAMLRMKLNKEFLFRMRPFLLSDSALEVIMIPLSALLAIPSINVIVILHHFGDISPFFDAHIFIYLFQYIVFLCQVWLTYCFHIFLSLIVRVDQIIIIFCVFSRQKITFKSTSLHRLKGFMI